VLVLAGACTSDEAQRAPVAPDDGIQLTGTIDGHRIAISDGEPEVVLGDCDPGDGDDLDLCVIARSIDGQTVGVVFENPAVFATAGSYPVSTAECEAVACDAVTTVAIVELRTDAVSWLALSGALDVRLSEGRYVADLRLELGDGGSVSGTINVSAPATP